jgi:GT2 family glycosyltransferase
LKPEFLERIVGALEARPDAASATGKLLRLDGKTLDSTGIVMLRSQRHLDRGADEPDRGQFDKPEDVFGPSGAAALYRWKALQDVAIDGQFFDEDFFAYREDADLAWRCRLLMDLYLCPGRRSPPPRHTGTPISVVTLINYPGKEPVSFVVE